MEYTKSQWAVRLPEPTVSLPRQHPPPKPVPLTKWERFRLEKGMPAAKEKRSRMVYDEVTQDWVPRYGMGSIKKIQAKSQWLMVEKPKHVEAGLDPFTYKKNEKKLDAERQNLRELKNKVLAEHVQKRGTPNDQVLAAAGRDGAKEGDEAPKKSLKARDEGARESIRKRERKSLMKSLTLAQ